MVTYHPISGEITFLLAILLTVTGLMALVALKCGNRDWTANRRKAAKGCHSVFAYFVIFVSQIAVSLGIYIYFDLLQQDAKGVSLILLNFGAFVVPLICLECLHQVRSRSSVSFTKVQASMSLKEFDEHVRHGRQLVILDEVVLDVASFVSHHPGGAFVIRHNVGRDISKFFHGGYSLDGNLGGRPAAGYKHSNYARMIVNSLITAQFEKEKPVQSTLCVLNDRESRLVNNMTKVLFLHSRDNSIVPNFRRFFPGLSNLGKHFLVTTLDGRKPSRHYTVCNVMHPNVYWELIRLLNDETSDRSKLLAALTTQDQSSMMFTIKNYNQPEGVSLRFFQHYPT